LPNIPAFTQASYAAFGYVPVLNEIGWGTLVNK
jgi:hypothetical protein